MTAYNGGKKRMADEIYNVLISLESKTGHKNLQYLEPFCGMCSVLLKFAVNEPHRKLNASDANPDMILLWNAIKTGWKPPSKCTRTLYDNLKNSNKHSALRGFIGIVCSYSAAFFHSFRDNYIPGSANISCRRGSKQLINCTKHLSNAKFKCQNYNNINPKNMLIYCDPPYRNNKITNPYFKHFDSDAFWELMRIWSRRNIVVVSEYTAPNDFICIWSKSDKKKMDKIKVYDSIERLFVHKSILNQLKYNLS
jgi:DNA adenine methylase